MKVWSRFDTAIDNISKADFAILDDDKDGILSFKELKDRANNQSLSSAGRLAARSLATDVRPHDILSRKGDPKIADPRALIGPIGISDWHRLDPKFKDISSSALRDKVSESTEKAVANPQDKLAETAVKEGFDELLLRGELVQPSSLERQIEEFIVCDDSLKTGMSLERDSSGKLELNGIASGGLRDNDIHHYLIDFVQARSLVRTDRAHYAESMYRQRKFSEAEKIFEESVSKSDVLVSIPSGSKFSLSRVVLDAQVNALMDNIRGGQCFNEVLRWPIESRTERAMFYMAPLVQNGKLYFDPTATHFQPDKAQRLINDAWIKATPFYKLDFTLPVYKDVGATNAFLLPSKWINFYTDADKNGTSDLIDHLKVRVRARSSLKRPRSDQQI